jgi:5-methylcytosine-specific restriction endonuclease McrA
MGKLAKLTPRVTPQHKEARTAVNAVKRRTGGWLVNERRRLFQRNPLCVGYKATAGHLAAAVHRDHVVPLWKGGPDHESNTQGLCDDCHKRKSADEAAERGAHT